MTSNVGTHALFDLEFDQSSRILTSPRLVERLLIRTCINAGSTVLFAHNHGFEGGGFTCSLVLAESHASCHTWPEYGLATFDIFMCGKCDAHVTMEQLMKTFRRHGFRINKYTQAKLFRGFIPEKYKE